jgi:hypothetical protein
MPLRPSQVETLRAVAMYSRPTKPCELGGYVGPTDGCSLRAAQARLDRLRALRYLNGCSTCGFSLTHEALEGKG